MKNAPNSNFNDRLKAANQARKAVMERISALPRVDEETLRAREAERQARRAEKDAQAEARRKALEEARIAEAARRETERREAEAANAEAAKALAAEQKAARDARYAARKARAKG